MVMELLPAKQQQAQKILQVAARGEVEEEKGLHEAAMPIERWMINVLRAIYPCKYYVS